MNRLVLSAAVLVASFSSPVLGQERDRPAIPTDSRKGRKLELRLSDCFELGDRANLELALNRLQELMGRQDVKLADAFFEPQLFATLDWRRSKSPPRNAFQPSILSKSYGGSLGIRKTFITGGSLDLAFAPRYTDQRVSSTFAFPTKFYTGDLTLTLKQPLLRGAWSDYALADFKAARQEQMARAGDFERARQELLDQTAGAYYELIFRREDYVVRFQSLELSRDQLENTEQKIKLGELAPRDRVADQADVAKKEEELISAENSILDAEDDLRRLILPFKDGKAWDFVLLPSDELAKDDPAYVFPDLSKALEFARKNRPDLAARQRRVEAARQRLVKAKRDLQPLLDLGGTYRAAGQRNAYSNLQSDIFESDFPEYTLSLNFVLPLGNKAARSRWSKSMLELEQSERSRHILQVDIEKAVRVALRALATTKKSIAAARESERLAKSDLESEQIKLKLGEGVRIEVQRRNQQYQDARSRLLRTRLDYRIAWFKLLAALGKIDTKAAERASVGHSGGH